MTNKLDRYGDWWGNRSPEEYELQRLAFDFEERHFADFRLATPSLRRQLLRYEIELDGKWIQTEGDPPDISIDRWIFRFCRMRKWNGLCNAKRRTIFINRGLDAVEHPATLLHEMIHAYESQLGPFREWLLLHLHKRLSKRIGPAKLRRYMEMSTHIVNLEAAHGLLFLLKSLDLDMRFDWTPGTVFGYGRADWFKPRRSNS